ncbi:LPS assembly protein LptD [uncultured Bilophila sp.]|uniref:LPS-assembly protein LptD n=2 Tax=uncultured Bilophila sp. TaxID=529385 RepID=UPI0026152FD6|nr:LPS assembly protein LptD [uncultured Bilophila sp.]
MIMPPFRGNTWLLLKTLCVCVLVMAMLLGTFGPAGAAEDVLTMPSEDAEQVSWNLQADQLTTLSDNTIVEAEGGVVLQRGNDILKADFARYYASTNWVYLKGNVFVRMGKDDINADEAEFDLHSKTGWLTNGHVFMEGPHIYFSGSRIVKHWGDRYTFNKAKVTTCDGPKPAWSMNAEQAVVEIDGYAQLFHSTFDVKDTGIFYSPFMVLPAKTTRQSGLLPPDYGFSDKRGFYYTQPYFWAIDESHDMTFYAGWMEKVGPLFSAEYRANEFTGQKTGLAATGIYDKERVSIPGMSRVDENLNTVRTNHDRYWLRGMADGFLGASLWQYRSNIDYVSDQDFLREFNQGPTGFTRSRDSLFRMFGRDLQEDDQNRVSALLLSRDWQRVGIVASARYEQDPALGHGNLRSRNEDELVQRLPQLDLFLYKGRIVPQFPLEIETQFESGYMYRAEGTTGWRSEIYPRLSFPLDLKYGSLIGTVGLRQTYYDTDRKDHTSLRAMYMDNSASPRQTGESRSLVDMDIQGYTQASRIWRLEDESSLELTPDNAGKRLWTAVRHEIQPRIRYSRTPHVDQEKNPFYIAEDRILPTNELTYSITNIITRKGAVVSVTGEGDKQQAQRTTMYQELVRWRLESGYDFEEAERERYRDEYGRRPFMDVLSDLEVYPWPWFGYRGKTYVSVYDGEVTRHDHDINLRYGNKISWLTGLSFRDKYYDYRRKFQYENWNNVQLSSNLRLLHNDLTVNLTPEWSVRIDDYRDMREGGSMGKTYDQSIDLAYTAQCYRIVGRYRYDGYDKSYSVMVELPGIWD